MRNCPAILIAIFVCCSGFLMTRGVPEAITLQGFTMGTTYQVIYFDSLRRNFKPQIDSLLSSINEAISVYDPASEVSVFNQANTRQLKVSKHLRESLKIALKVAEASHGSFDPTVMPFVNAWGFGPVKNQMPDSVKIDSIMLCVGFDKIALSDNVLTKADPCVQLDFGGIGQGYAADVTAEFLKSKGVVNFLVEIGGEGVTSGKNLSRDNNWTVGILDPNSTRGNQFFMAYASLSNRAFTTSGNYFNYRERHGRRFGHAISPQTGFPVEHNLLSVSVFAADCTTADAWATAFLVMGYEKAAATLEHHPELDAFFIYSLPDGSHATFATSSLESFITMEP